MLISHGMGFEDLLETGLKCHLHWSHLTTLMKFF
jgi:hypothetical protein